jgi:nucleotide-binding universal stress UspA family protein
MKILVAADGTEYGQAAVEMAGDIAAGLKNAEIKVVSVYETPAMTVAGPYLGAPVWYPDMVEGAKAVADGAASSARKAFNAECPAVAVNSVVCMGGPADTILETAKEWGADLIVMGSHGYGFWGRTFYGSVSDQVVHHAPCSVLVVRSRTTDCQSVG